MIRQSIHALKVGGLDIGKASARQELIVQFL